MLCGRNTHHDKQSSIYSGTRKFISSEAVQQFALLQILALLSQFYDPEHVASRKKWGNPVLRKGWEVSEYYFLCYLLIEPELRRITDLPRAWCSCDWELWNTITTLSAPLLSPSGGVLLLMVCVFNGQKLKSIYKISAVPIRFSPAIPKYLSLPKWSDGCVGAAFNL